MQELSKSQSLEVIRLFSATAFEAYSLNLTGETQKGFHLETLTALADSYLFSLNQLITFKLPTTEKLIHDFLTGF